MIRIRWAFLAVIITFLLSSFQSDVNPFLYFMRLYPFIKIGAFQIGISMTFFTLVGLVSGIAFLVMVYYSSRPQKS